LAPNKRTEFDIARDELMNHIHRCGVLKATQQHQDEWFTETMEYMKERYTGLTANQLTQLEQIGKRFCQPVIRNGEQVEATEQGEMVGAA
jgi:hypothetical protein